MQVARVQSTLLLSFAILLVLGVGCSEDVAPEGCPEDCPERFCLEDNTCSAPRCPEDGECPDGQYCDAEINRCLTGCKLDEVCSDGQVCDPNTRECVACNPDAGLECLEGVCFESEGRCVMCASDADCGFGTATYCQPQTNECIPGCIAPQNCPSSLECDAATQRCVGCREDRDCSGLKCVENGQNNFCAECVADPGCGVGSGEYCDPATFACISGCVDDISCPSGQTCNISQRRCE